MLRLTRTAIGLLTAQYRSVLRKCWAINVGVFALATIVATVPSQAEAMTADEMLAILRNTTTSSEISWSSASKVTDPTVKPAAPTISGGVVRFDIEGIPYDFAYTYTKPQSWAEIKDETHTDTVDVSSSWGVYTDSRIREYTDSISNSVFVNNSMHIFAFTYIIV